MNKKCGKCGQVKSTDEFYRDRSRKDGLTIYCKICVDVKNAKWRKNNPKKEAAAASRWRNNNTKKAIVATRLWRKNNPEKIVTYGRQYRKSNSKKVAATKRRWQENNLEKIAEAGKRWREDNPQRMAVLRKRYRATSKGKLNEFMAKGIRMALKGRKAGRRWEGFVGYSVKSLVKHLEKLFQPGMSWDNHGPGWHIDHIIPKSKFNYSRPEHIDFKRCWALKNLQPLWKKENLKKSAKLKKPFQPSLALG